MFTLTCSLEAMACSLYTMYTYTCILYMKVDGIQAVQSITPSDWSTRASLLGTLLQNELPANQSTDAVDGGVFKGKPVKVHTAPTVVTIKELSATTT